MRQEGRRVAQGDRESPTSMTPPTDTREPDDRGPGMAGAEEEFDDFEIEDDLDDGDDDDDDDDEEDYEDEDDIEEGDD